MPFCSHCGASVTEEMSFCPGCGTRLATVGEAYAETTDLVSAEESTILPQYTGVEADYLESGDYRVILVSRGVCQATAAAELLEDLLGYTSVQARRLLHMAPAEVACNLTLTQAQYIAQALTEYGMEASVTDAVGGYMDLPNATTSVFDSYGNLLPAVAVALAVLTGVNRVRRITTWGRDGLMPTLFGLGFRRPVPPRHMRRAPMAHPPRRPAASPRAFAPRPAAPRPAPAKPAAPRGGMGFGPAGGSRGPGGRGSGGRGPGGSGGPGGPGGRRR